MHVASDRLIDLQRQRVRSVENSRSVSSPGAGKLAKKVQARPSTEGRVKPNKGDLCLRAVTRTIDSAH